MGNLAISKNGRQPLSQNQVAFNKLTARIEKLHKDISKKQLQFDKAMSIYSTFIHPLRSQLVVESRNTIDALWPIYQCKKLPNSYQKHFRLILQYHLQEILELGDAEPDEDLKAIFRELEGTTYEKAKERETTKMKEQMQSMFDQMDIDIDVNEFGADSEGLAEKLAEAQQKSAERHKREQQQRAHRQKHAKKSVKQLEKEKLQLATEEMKHKNISTIYKQLAKLFHPDLEQDETLRAEKEVLMKELTAAYEAKNLHTLLSLEMKWIHRENDHLGTLTDEKLAIYLGILREQALELERERQMVFQQPRYGVLFQEYGYNIASQPIDTVDRERREMEAQLGQLKTDIHHFKSKDHLGYIKEMIKAFRQQQQQFDQNDFLDLLINGF